MLVKKQGAMIETDTKQYLSFYSCHPNHTKRRIPYNLARRIHRRSQHGLYIYNIHINDFIPFLQFLRFISFIISMNKTFTFCRLYVIKLGNIAGIENYPSPIQSTISIKKAILYNQIPYLKHFPRHSNFFTC